MQEEWVICRVFQKGSAAKKPQQTSSSQPSQESPHSMVNEFGDVDLPNLNSIANSSSSFTNNISGQTNNNHDPSTNVNTNMTINWPSATDLVWPSRSLLNPNLSMNSLLLKALQLRNTYQQREAAVSDHHFATYVPQGFSHNNIASDHHLTQNLSASSSSKALESCVPQPQQEQPFNMDSIWWSTCLNHVPLVNYCPNSSTAIYRYKMVPFRSRMESNSQEKTILLLYLLWALLVHCCRGPK